MPKPDPKMKSSFGEKVRITEKNKYRQMASENCLGKLVEALNKIPQTMGDNQPITEQAKQCIEMLKKELPGLNTKWKKYVRAYSGELVLDLNQADKESGRAAEFFNALHSCMEDVRKLKDDPIYYEDHFLHVRVTMENIHGHYQEMQFGTLNLNKYIKNPDEVKAQIRNVSEDPEYIDAQTMKSMFNAGKRYKNKGVIVDPCYLDRSGEPLFPHEPSPDDIYQGSLGDCYFVAALSAICAANPHLIRSMMKDNGNTVTVPVWDVDDIGRVVAKPVFVTVRKTVPGFKLKKSVPGEKPVNSTTYIFSKTALWVQMMEKAYVAAGLNWEKKSRDRIGKHFRDIEGGNEATALRVILGRNVHSRAIFARTNDMDNCRVRQIDDPEEIFRQVISAVEHGHIVMAGSGSSARTRDLVRQFRREVQEQMDKERIVLDDRVRRRIEHKNRTGQSVLQREEAKKTEEQRQREAEEEDLERQKTERVRRIREEIGDRIFHGIVLDFNKAGDPVPAQHAYAVTNAYVKDGKKYIVVRNPHGKQGQDPDDPRSFDERQRGYSAIPVEEFRAHFDTLICAVPNEPSPRLTPEAGYQELVSTCLKNLDNTMSVWERGFGRSAMSREFGEFYTALKEAKQACSLDSYPSGYSLARIFNRLGKAAQNYLDQKRFYVDRDNTHNVRVIMAKTCVTMAACMNTCSDPEQAMEKLRETSVKMVTKRVNFYVQKASENESLRSNLNELCREPQLGGLLNRMDMYDVMRLSFEFSLEQIPEGLREVQQSLEQMEQNPQDLQDGNRGQAQSRRQSQNREQNPQNQPRDRQNRAQEQQVDLNVPR